MTFEAEQGVVEYQLHGSCYHRTNWLQLSLATSVSHTARQASHKSSCMTLVSPCQTVLLSGPGVTMMRACSLGL